MASFGITGTHYETLAQGAGRIPGNMQELFVAYVQKLAA